MSADNSDAPMCDQPFVPGPAQVGAYRDALGCFATGVTVVTMCDADGPVGMTANSFASLSLDPALVLWSPARGSVRHDRFAAAAHFCIHVLENTQQPLALHFARSGLDFDNLSWHANPDGVPVLDGCLARFECARWAVHDGGDHSLVIGQVRRAARRDGTGLVFKRGQYGLFSTP